MSATRSYLCSVNIGLGNGLGLSGNKPVPKPMLIQIYVTMWCHYAIMSNIKLYTKYSSHYIVSNNMEISPHLMLQNWYVYDI